MIIEGELKRTSVGVNGFVSFKNDSNIAVRTFKRNKLAFYFGKR